MPASSPSLDGRAKTLIALSSLRSIMGTFLSSFFIAYIMGVSGKAIADVAIYNLGFYLAIAAGCAAIGGYVKRGGRALSYRAASGLMIVLLGLIAAFPSEIPKHILACGCLYGLSCALQAYPYNVLVGERVPMASMPKFSGYKEVFVGICKIAAPFALGLFISAKSYESTAKAMIFVALAEFLLLSRIRDSAAAGDGKIRPAACCRAFWRNPLARRIYLVEFLRALTFFGAFSTLFTMYVVYIFRTPMNLGLITSGFAIVSISLAAVFGRCARKAHFPLILRICNASFLAASALFIWRTEAWSFWIFSLACATSLKTIEIITDVNLFNASNHASVDPSLRAEFFLLREAALGAGRATGYLALLGVGIFGGQEWLRPLLLVLALGVVWLGWLSIGLSKESKER